MANYRNGRLRDETDRQDRTVPTGGAGQVAQVSGAGTVKQEPVSAGANSQKPVGYQQSDAFRQAQQMLKQQMAQKPGQYQSAWQDQLDEIMGKILGREEFKYDLNGDALYQQYKDQYTRNGQMAMMDTMGQAAALTGGYGNSYAQTVGQQTYNGYLQQLNDRIPELYQLALDKYRMEGDALMDQYALIGARDDQDYGRYRDGLSDYYQQMGLITDVYRDERNFGYGVDRDQEADRQWQAEFDEAKRRYDQQWAEAHPEEEEKENGSGGPWYQNPYQDDGNGDEPLVGSHQKHDEQMAALAAQNASTAKVQNFMKSLHPESQHDAIMRDKWGSYRQYVAYQIEHSNLTDAEKIYLINHYGIRESDTDYKN